jgi:SAM-dependent methyltransferase
MNPRLLIGPAAIWTGNSCFEMHTREEDCALNTESEMTIQAGAKENYPGLQRQQDESSRGWLFRTLRRYLRAQFGRPTGFVGTIVGRIMARRESNNQRISWTVSLLNVKPRDRVLEIGFGPGIAIELVSKMATEGTVVGVDHSPVMLQQAAKRNALAVREGKVALHQSSVSDLPAFDAPFDAIFTINSIHFWHDPVERLKELRRLLKPGGLIAVTIQPRAQNATDETARIVGEEVASNLERAGFSQCRLELKKMAPVSVACALGVN